MSNMYGAKQTRRLSTTATACLVTAAVRLKRGGKSPDTEKKDKAYGGDTQLDQDEENHEAKYNVGIERGGGGAG
jgi:hypothetical protein